MALLHVGLIQFLTGLIRVQGTTQNADDILLASFEYKEVHIRSLRAIYSSFYLAAISFSIMLNSSCLVCLRSKNFNCTQAKLITYHLIEFCCKNDFSYFRVFQVFKEDDDLLLEEELGYLDEKLRNEEIDDICNQVGVIHPIMYDGYDLCEQVRLDKLSAFTVSTLRTMCKHFLAFFQIQR